MFRTREIQSGWLLVLLEGLLLKLLVCKAKVSLEWDSLHQDYLHWNFTRGEEYKRGRSIWTEPQLPVANGTKMKRHPGKKKQILVVRKEEPRSRATCVASKLLATSRRMEWLAHRKQTLGWKLGR